MKRNRALISTLLLALVATWSPGVPASAQEELQPDLGISAPSNATMTASPPDGGITALSTLQCSLQVMEPHASVHNPFTTNVTGRIDCNGVVGISSTLTIYELMDDGYYRRINANQYSGTRGVRTQTLSPTCNTGHKYKALQTTTLTFPPGYSPQVQVSTLENSVVVMCYTLQPGQYLRSNKLLKTGNNRYIWAMQGDGNLVEYGEGRVIWHSCTMNNPGAYAVMQYDGNFVIYSAAGRALWASHSSGDPGAHVFLQGNDGNGVVYNRHHTGAHFDTHNKPNCWGRLY